MAKRSSRPTLPLIGGKNGRKFSPPNHPFVHRVWNHYFNKPSILGFLNSPYFWVNTHELNGCLDFLGVIFLDDFFKHQPKMLGEMFEAVEIFGEIAGWWSLIKLRTWRAPKKCKKTNGNPWSLQQWVQCFTDVALEKFGNNKRYQKLVRCLIFQDVKISLIISYHI